MPRKRHTPEEIVGILREAAIRAGPGEIISAVCQEMGISEAIYYRGKK